MLDQLITATRTQDGNYVMAGISDSNDGDVSGNHGLNDFWIVKIAGDGNCLWKKSFGGSHQEMVHSIAATLDGGVAVAGQSSSSDGDISNPKGLSDMWVIKLDDSGNLLWEKSYGSFGVDWAKSIIQTSDSGFILSGVSSNYPNAGDFLALIKTDPFGNIKNVAGVQDGRNPRLARQDGTFMAVSGLQSSPQDLTVEKIDSNFTVIWSKTMGGTGNEGGDFIMETNDGGFIFAGNTNSNDGDVHGNHGGYDFWIVKLEGWATHISGISQRNKQISFYPNPANIEIQFSERVNVKMINLVGEVVLQQKNITRLDISQNPTGVYFLIFTDENEEIIQVEKLIKE